MASENLNTIIETVLTIQNVIAAPVITLSSLFLVYGESLSTNPSTCNLTLPAGLYTIVFGLSIHVLHHKRSTSPLYMICTVFLFILATIAVVIETLGLVRQSSVGFRALKAGDYEPLVDYMESDKVATAWISITNITANLMNAIADIMLIHRCYAIWESRRALLYALAIPAFVLNGIALAGSTILSLGTDNPAYASLYVKADRITMSSWIATAVFNNLLSFLTGGRIWWISRESRRYLGEQTNAKYKAIVATILESGALYSTTLIVAMVVPLVFDPDSNGIIPVDLAILSTLMAGLAPTLIIVRVAYGKSVDSVQQQVTSIHFARREVNQTSQASVSESVDNSSRCSHSIRGADMEIVVSPGNILHNNLQ